MLRLSFLFLSFFFLLFLHLLLLSFHFDVSSLLFTSPNYPMSTCSHFYSHRSKVIFAPLIFLSLSLSLLWWQALCAFFFQFDYVDLNAEKQKKEETPESQFRLKMRALHLLCSSEQQCFQSISWHARPCACHFFLSSPRSYFNCTFEQCTGKDVHRRDERAQR